VSRPVVGVALIALAWWLLAGDLPTFGPSGPYRVVIVYDGDLLDDMDEDQRALIKSLAVRDELAELGHVWERAYTTAALDDVPADTDLGRMARGLSDNPTPCMAWAPLGGGEVQEGPLPDDLAGLLEVLK